MILLLTLVLCQTALTAVYKRQEATVQDFESSEVGRTFVSAHALPAKFYVNRGINSNSEEFDGSQVNFNYRGL